MIRKIIQIDEEKCNGCGLCAAACHEEAIAIIDGKAKLIRDDYCDGLGNCLPACPAGAIKFIEREAAAYDEAAVLENKRAKETVSNHKAGTEDEKSDREITYAAPVSRLSQWPVQIKLVPTKAPYFDGADLLIAADCTAYAYGNFHEDFMRGRAVVVGCPKLDAIDYSEKLTEILLENDIKSITLTRMIVPCCGGLSYAAEVAVKNCGKQIPLNVVTIGIDGNIIE